METTDINMCDICHREEADYIFENGEFYIGKKCKTIISLISTEDTLDYLNEYPPKHKITKTFMMIK